MSTISPGRISTSARSTSSRITSVAASMRSRWNAGSISLRCMRWIGAVDGQQPVAQQRDQVAHVARAPEEVLGVRHQHVVVGLGAEHEDGVVMEDLEREDRAEALVGVDQQARGGSCSKRRVRARLKLFSPGGNSVSVRRSSRTSCHISVNGLLVVAGTDADIRCRGYPSAPLRPGALGSSAWHATDGA